MDEAYLALFATGLRLSIPLIFAALGGIWSERAGVFNLALEGSILSGAFGAALGSFYFHSAWAGLAVGLLAAGLTGLLLAVMTVWLAINQMVAGIAINMFIIGLTSFLSRIVFSGQNASDRLSGFSALPIPGLSSLPWIGNLLFNQDVLIYMMYALIPLAWWLLFHSTWGLNLRATGEYPQAVDSAGLSVFGIRFISVVGAGMVAGLGGCYLVLSQVFIFTEHMSAGKGFIALAALILGRWHPVGALAACLLFGLADAVQLRLQFSHPDVPYQLFVILPYVASIGALIIFAGKIRPPAAAGEHYQRGGK
ncbi:simple sugar transport system permease protein|uniref:Nucleoside ABC transporter membrane protein n=1 Tax=Brenneria salicis ATCC 15712 = DSM 30166 TaxID=714314 RepID=A0A366HXB9_9GAMM|nr:ABC transporter permease [Brenneria salicis]NMN93277.1 simple sugar transport system permease protein [Brenneria salicis ATCC 15712 = DSM 30166]RBP57914.1 nucleoside ABC transporter membrane protein [Brenneria salicis ATCC 15712 = DSM 30166]RLM28916.1 branched-chain amino acid ABC transporter permease [Brenneria salicis ATCC 15712 = DSM 30166]